MVRIYIFIYTQDVCVVDDVHPIVSTSSFNDTALVLLKCLKKVYIQLFYPTEKILFLRLSKKQNLSEFSVLQRESLKKTL